MKFSYPILLIWLMGMKDSDFPSIDSNNNRTRKKVDPPVSFSILPRNKRPRNGITKSAILRLQILDVPLISPAAGSPIGSIHLESDRPYTIGRAACNCDFLFNDRRVSRRHCQVLFDGVDRKIYILDGAILLDAVDSVVSTFRKRLLSCNELEGVEKETKTVEWDGVKGSLNGVFVNGVRVKRGMVRELCVGDEVLLVCGNKGMCSLGVGVGFVIKGIIIKEEVDMFSDEMQLERPKFLEEINSMGHNSQGSVSSGQRSKRVFAVSANDIKHSGFNFSGPQCGGIASQAKFFLSQCKGILKSDDPISRIREYASPDFGMETTYAGNNRLNNSLGAPVLDTAKLCAGGETEANKCVMTFRKKEQVCTNLQSDMDTVNYVQKGNSGCVCIGGDHSHNKGIARAYSEIDDANQTCNAFSPAPMVKDSTSFNGVFQTENSEEFYPAPGKNFYLNRLHSLGSGPFSDHNVISLPELLYPIESISQIFIATFTCDVSWFLSYCQIPSHLPVTIACHNTEHCWSSSADKRTSMPNSDFPYVVMVFPQFPEEIAFGKDRKRQGIACHHPKLFVLQREDSIRVIITSANLVANQWTNVTNTIWWQDFPARSAPDLSSLFDRVSERELDQDSGSDFAAQLAGFMASLLTDVPSQAHWIIELTKYDFSDATGYLIASVPGIYSSKSLHEYQCSLQPSGEKVISTVETSVVGLSHLYHTAADTNGAQLKRLAAFMGKSRENDYGMVEVVLRRNINVPADLNAVGVLVPNPDLFSQGDCVQLGFLPRNVAKWVSPLWDGGFFRFSGYVYPKDALAAAFGGSNLRVQLILCVSQGPCSDVMRMMQPENSSSFCSLIASIQRCVGLWRLQEVLGLYKWIDMEQSDFIYGASSIGSSVNAQFLASFAAAAGKRSLQAFDSEESDPEWGCWSATQELKNPSIRVIFPTIERVKSACCGILPSRRILCFSEKTWQKLKTIDVLHDAVPHPHDRVGWPMHVKVACRRFQSQKDASSFGWVYCGSHNFSAAAWGRPIANPVGLGKINSSFGSRLHICNYEIGILFVFPPAETGSCASKDLAGLDDIALPFVVPAPKYGPRDRPATAQAMREALAERTEQEGEKLVEFATTEEDTIAEIPDEEEDVVETNECPGKEKEEEKAYAETLWIQVDSSQGC